MNGLMTSIRNMFGHAASTPPPGFRVVPDYYGRSHRKQLDIRMLPVFGALAKEVIEQKRTYLYYDRLYTLFQGIQNMRHLPDGLAVAEVGVFRGGGSRFLDRSLHDAGVGRRPLHCFDTFEGHAAQDIQRGIDDAAVHVADKFGSTSLDDVRRYLADLPDITLHAGRIQDTAAQVREFHFGFVHLDVDLYEPTAFGLDFFGDRLAPGGMMVVDDFDCTTCPGTRRAVDEFVGRRKDFAMVALLSAQCLLIKHA